MAFPVESLVILSTFLVLSAGWLVHHFSSPGISALLKLVVTISFTLGFGGIALLPIDLTITQVFEDGKGDDQPPNETYGPWMVVYWSTFFLAWGFLPLFREALLSGQFTFATRLKAGCRTAIRSYIFMVVLSMTAVIALAVKLHDWNVVPVLMALGNTYGLLMVSLLLGYGLVDLPRHMWEKADAKMELRRKQIMASNADEALFDAVWELQDCEDLVDAAASKVGEREEDGGRPALDLHYSYCLDRLLTLRKSTARLSPELQRRRTSSDRRHENDNGDAIMEGSDYDDDDYPSLDYLAQLNARLEAAQAGVVSAEQRWNALFAKSNLYTHLAEGTVPRPPPLELSISDSVLTKVGKHFAIFREYIRYWWLTLFRTPVYRVIGFLGAVLSVAVMWSEATLAIPFNLSPFALLLRLFDNDGDKGLLFQIAALFPLVYVSTCVFSSLFKLSFFGRYRLRGFHQSTGVALVFNAQYLVRLQFPLAYNYLLMIKYDTSTTNCAFSHVMSNMSTVPFLGTSFSVYAPLLILALCGFTLCNGYARLLAFLGIEHEDSILACDDETLDGKVNEGITLLRRHSERTESSMANLVNKELGEKPDTSSSWRTGLV